MKSKGPNTAGKIRIQHYVPQWYLKKWAAAQSPRIGVFDKSEARAFRTNVRNVAGEAYFFRRERSGQPLESFFSVVEARMAAVWTRILNSGRARNLTEVERADLCMFVAMMLVRTREHREELRQVQETMMNTIARRMGVTDWKVVVNEEGALAQQLGMIPEIPKFARILWELEITLQVNRTPLTFTTSDHPVVRFNSLPPRPNGGGRLGIASPGIQLYLPLSPGLCLLMCDPFAHPRLPDPDILDDYRNVVFVRGLELTQSFRHVFGIPNGGFKFEKEAVRDDPSVGMRDRKRIGTVGDGAG